MVCPFARFESSPKRRAAGALVALALTAAVAAQQDVPVDPYTRGDAAAMARAGYVSFGPFPFGEGHTTTTVEELLGDEPLCWIETAHFKIGCAASALPVKRGDKEWKRGLKRELKRLRERLPRVKTTARELDPWLRAHLIAQRLEDCYAEIQRDLGVTDADFPSEPMDPAEPESYGGLGPYLGMPEKFSVLILRRTASNARYTRAYAGYEASYPLRIYFPTHGALGVCMSEEYNSRQLADDQTLHVHLVYNVVVNLLNGYRSYGHEVPAWLLIGLAHWHSRRICPRYPVYEFATGNEKEDDAFWKWDERALGLLKFEAFEPVEELIKREEGTQFGMEQHIQSWFLVDYLMHRRKAEMMRFLHVMKDPFHLRRRKPSHDEVTARQLLRFEEVFGVTPEALEAEWKKAARSLSYRK